MDICALDFLKQLLATPTPSGFEQDGMRLIARYLKNAGIETSAFDLHGNLHVSLNASAPTRVMLEAHCDEIGFLVQYIDENGFLYMIANGGVTVPTVAGERIVIQGREGPVNGVFGVRPPHVLSAAEKDKVAPKDLSEIAVDIGAKNRAEAEVLVDLGAPAVIDSGWRQLAGSRVACRGFDNRIGVFINAEVMRRLKDAELNVALHMAATVQEELGLVGAASAAYAVNPHVGICLDVGFATDASPQDRRKQGDVRLGSGPILGTGPFYNPKLHEFILETARLEGIDCQRQVRARASGNNAFQLRMQRRGAATALISIPLRYMHSPVEVLDLDDVEKIIELLCGVLRRMPGNPDLTPDL